MWLVRPAGEAAHAALARVRPSAADLADAAAWVGAERSAARLRRRLLLRAFAADVLGAPADAVELVRDPGGRPRIVAPTAAFASVARGGDWAALAVSPHPVGVDLAATQSAAAPPLPHADLAVLRAPDASPEAQATLLSSAWAAREAYLKATGAGLAGADALRLQRVADGLRVVGPAGAASVHLHDLGAWTAAAVVL